MPKYKFGDVVREIKINIDRNNNPYEFYIAGEHMDTNELHLQRRGTFEGSDVGPAFIRLFKPGQILYGSRRTYLRKVAVADFEGITSNTTFVLESKDETKLCQRLLPFIMLSDDFTQYSISKSKGSTNPYILFSDLSEYELDLPEIEQQRALADILWALDDTKKAYRNLIISTDELVKSQFIEMFSGVKVQSRLDELCAFFGDGDWIESKDQSPSGIRLIQTGNVGNGEYKEKGERARYISEETFQRLNCTEIKEGDVLISRLPDPIGRACILPAIPKSITAVDCTIVRFKEHILPSYFVAMTKTPLYTAQIDAFTTGSTRKRVSRANLGSILVPVPEMSLQMEFVAIAQQSDKSKFNVQIAIYRDVQGM